MRSGNVYTGANALIGHGAYSIQTWDQGWQRNDDMILAGAAQANDGVGVAGTGAVPANGTALTAGDGLDRRYSFNWGPDNRTRQSIARLADVYGDINVRTGLVEDPVTHVLAPTSAAGVVLVQAGQTTGGSMKYAQIGHGGPGDAGSMEGDINVEAGGAISILGGPKRNEYAMIGHTITSTETNGDWRVGMGLFDDGDGIPEAGETGWTPDGKLGGGQQKQFRYFRRPDDFNNVTQRTGTLTTVIPNQVGNPGAGMATGIYGGGVAVTGMGAGVFSNLQGDIDVTSAMGGVRLEAFADGVTPTEVWSGQAFVQIGHGGVQGGLDRTNARGNINVEANGVGADLSVIAGYGSRNYAQIGHGGFQFTDTSANRASNYLQGNITVSASGDMLIEGGGRFLAPNANVTHMEESDNYAMIGHGGYAVYTALKTGDIAVTVGGDLTVTGGALGTNFAQIGHGGYQSFGQIGGDFTRTVNIPDTNGVNQLVNTTIKELRLT